MAVNSELEEITGASRNSSKKLSGKGFVPWFSSQLLED